jgi:hypothetical protein
VSDKSDRIAARRRLIVGVEEPEEPPVDPVEPPPEVEPERKSKGKRRKGKGST